MLYQRAQMLGKVSQTLGWKKTNVRLKRFKMFGPLEPKRLVETFPWLNKICLIIKNTFRWHTKTCSTIGQNRIFNSLDAFMSKPYWVQVVVEVRLWLRLMLTWCWGWSEVDIEVKIRIRMSWSVVEAELRLSQVEVMSILGWIEGETGLSLGYSYGLNILFSSTRTAEQHLFSMFPSILTFNLDQIYG